MAKKQTAAVKKAPEPTGPPMTGMTRRFQVIVTCRVELELDQCVIDELSSDDWQRQFYKLNSPEKIAAFIGSNMARDGECIDFVEGCRLLPLDSAVITDDEWESEATEQG